MPIRKVFEFILVLILLLCIGSFAQGAYKPESQESAIGHAPPRLSLTTGEVSFWRPGAQDWSRAQVNTPLAPGDLLNTGADGKFEIQIGPRAFVRGGPDTQLGLENREPDFLHFTVTAGNASFDLRTVEPGRTVEVDTPHGVFTIEQNGYYRLAVFGEQTSFITRRGGHATITSSGGEIIAVGPSEEVTIEGIEMPQVASYAAPELDKWDRWNYARTDHLLDAVSARYVSAGVYGVPDLDRYGTWRIVPTYGAVWIPRGVPSGWTPYSTGTWVLDPYYGWTWVDIAPWGWAPYHYGRWVHMSGFWAWAPGPVVVRPVYAPALVAFFGSPGASVSINVGVWPVVGWVSLGWGEPCTPWWGPPSFRHQPWWGGWGGPRVANKVVIKKTTVVKVHEINVYRNVGVRNAVVVVEEKHFGRDPIASARVRWADAKNLKPIHNLPRGDGAPANFAPKGKSGIPLPGKVLDKPTVATHPLKMQTDLGSEKKGQEVSARLPNATSRIVSAPHQGETASLRMLPSYGKSKASGGTNDRALTAASEKIQRQQPRKQELKAAPSVTTKAPQQRQRGPQVAHSSPPKAHPSGRQKETRAPSARVPPGDSVRRLSSNRTERGWQQPIETLQQPAQMKKQSMPQNEPRERQGNYEGSAPDKKAMSSKKQGKEPNTSNLIGHRKSH